MAKIARNDRFHATAQQWENRINDMIERALTAGDISSDDAGLFREYCESKISTNTELSTLFKNLQALILFRKFMPVEYRQASLKAVLAGKKAIESLADAAGNPVYSRATQKHCIVVVKSFFYWGLRDGSSWSKLSPAQLRLDVKPVKVAVKSKKITDIMTADEVVRLIDAADNSRDRAMMALQYECALRAVDIGRLRWGDITIVDEKSSSIVVENKTDYPRHIAVVLYNGYLNAWKRDAPNSKDESGFVFTTHGNNFNGSQIRLNTVRDVIMKCARLAGITGRKVSPHTLRHSRITYWLQHDVSIAKICMMAWGVEYSPMIKTYGHMGNDDTAKEQRRLAGISENEIVQTGMLSLASCPVCGLACPPGRASGYCNGCGSPLDGTAAAKIDARSSAAEHEKDELKARLAAMEDKYNTLIELLSKK